MNRRDFLKTAALGTAGVVMGKGMTMAHTTAGEPVPTAPPDSLLAGVSDIHIHCAPDSVERAMSELDMAREARKAGYRSVMFKSNDFSSHDRAYLVQEAVPGIKCFGSLVMNCAHGDMVNIRAAELAIKTSGNRCRCIWMPTMDAAYQYSFLKRQEKGIAVLDDAGTVLPEVVRVMELCAEADIIFATGHSSPAESLVLAGKAKEIGVKKFVVTHANSNFWKMTHDQVRQCIDLGAFIEYSYITNLWGPGTGLPNFTRMSDEEFVAFARINPERSFITTDLGQVGMPLPLEGMRKCISTLLSAGMPQRDIDFLVRSNPAWLVRLVA